MSKPKVGTIKSNLFGKDKDDDEEEECLWKAKTIAKSHIVNNQFTKPKTFTKPENTPIKQTLLPKPIYRDSEHIKAKSLSFENNAIVDFTGVQVKGLLPDALYFKDLKIAEEVLPKEFNQEKSFTKMKFLPGAVVDFSNAEVVGIPSIKDNIITPQNRNTAYIIEDSASISSLITNILISGKTITTGSVPTLTAQFDAQPGREYIIEASATVKDYVDTPLVKTPLSFNTVYAYCAASCHKLGIDVVPHGQDQFWKADNEIFDGIDITVVPVANNKLAIITTGLPSKTLYWWYSVKVTGNGSVSRIMHVNNQKA